MTQVRLLIICMAAIAVLGSCSVRPVYTDQGKKLAQIGVDQFHERYNRNDYDGLYALMSSSAKQGQPKDVAVPLMKQTAEYWGKELASSMVFIKVIPGPPDQIRMIYNTTYEKGKAQEWFTWTWDGKQVSLFKYQIFLEWADEKAMKSASSQ